MTPEAELNDSTAIGLLQARQAALLAPGVPERRPLVRPHDALAAIRALLHRVEPLLAPGGPAEAIYRDDHLAHLRTLASGLLADGQTFYGAWLRLQNRQPPAQQEHQQTADALRTWDARLYPWAWAAFHQQPTLRPLLDDIRRGTGTRDDADDVHRLVLMILTHWPDPSTLPYPRADLEAAAALATRYLALERTAADSSSERQLRDRAFGVLSAHFFELRYAAIALTRDEAMPKMPGK